MGGGHFVLCKSTRRGEAATLNGERSRTTRASLRGASLRGASLRGASLRGASLRGVVLFSSAP